MKQLCLSVLFYIAAITSKGQVQQPALSVLPQYPLLVQPVMDSVKTAPVLTPGIHILPLDNMPCLVPYTGNIAKMPNAAMPVTGMPKVVLDKIPNPFWQY